MLLLTACSGNQQEKVDGQGADTIYTEKLVMSLFRANPDRALVVIDSAVSIGNVTQERGQYLKALTYYNGVGDMATARQLCKDMIASPAVARDTAMLESVYAMMVAISSSTGNEVELMHYATEASKLAHALNNPNEVATMACDIASVLEHRGQKAEAEVLYKKTIDELREVDSFYGVNAYHTCSKRLLHFLLDEARYDEMPPVCQAMLDRLNELADHPEHFEIPENLDLNDYVDFALGQTYAFFCAAYATMGSKDEVRRYEAEMRRTEWSHTLDCDRMMVTTYLAIGDWDELDKVFARSEASFKDTLSHAFLVNLINKSLASKRRGRTIEALDLMERAYTIKDSLDNRQMQEQLAELATVYHLQEEQVARQEAEANARFFRLLTIAIIVGLLAAIAFAVYFFYKRRETNKKNHVLAREIAEAIKYKEMWENSQAYSSTLAGEDSLPGEIEETGESGISVDNEETEEVSLFQQLREVILRDQLYLDPQLDRQALVERFNLPKERIGAAFSKGSPFKSLIDFLTDCRLPYAAKLLTERPDLSVADIARQSGFSSADTFSRNFRQKYAITPTQFREQQEQS
jgi:AraC-like DNA-binding protein